MSCSGKARLATTPNVVFRAFHIRRNQLDNLARTAARQDARTQLRDVLQAGNIPGGVFSKKHHAKFFTIIRLHKRQVPPNQLQPFTGRHLVPILYVEKSRDGR